MTPVSFDSLGGFAGTLLRPSLFFPWRVCHSRAKAFTCFFLLSSMYASRICFFVFPLCHLRFFGLTDALLLLSPSSVSMLISYCKQPVFFCLSFFTSLCPCRGVFPSYCKHAPCRAQIDLCGSCFSLPPPIARSVFQRFFGPPRKPVYFPFSGCSVFQRLPSHAPSRKGLFGLHDSVPCHFGPLFLIHSM